MTEDEIRKRKKEAEARGFHFKIKMIKCGKSGCTKCPHGPYLYARKYEDGDEWWVYIGRI